MAEKSENKKNLSIGVLDSGLGGLTVVRVLEQILPEENIIYFGDNKNVPYGNRPKEEIKKLTINMLDFLKSKGVKIAAIACNTISAIADELRPLYDFPIISIIEEASKYVAAENITEVGLFATEFTVKTAMYKTLIQKLRPETLVCGIPSRTLAELVDSGRFGDNAIVEEVRSLLGKLRSEQPKVKHVILGCTHYPIVQDVFEAEAQDTCFINPAAVQAEAVKSILTEQNLLNDCNDAFLEINTSGVKEQYEAAVKKLKISRNHTISIK